MKKYTLFLLICTISLITKGQDLSTKRITDWNTLRLSGFYESYSGNIINAPSNYDWLWGINISHSTNISASNVPYHYGAQILFPIKTLPTVAPEMYIRSMTKEGEGMWAKVVHSKGNHAIDGKLVVKEIEIKLVTGADFVFSPDYNLRPLSEIEAFVKENRHLPEIPSEKKMQEDGVNVNELQIKLLQKIEELTLYVIEQDKKIEELQRKLESKE